MDSDFLVAFDFDGTLYPLAPYDSEELLMHLNGTQRGKLWQKRTKQAVGRDMDGRNDMPTFNRDYRIYTTGATKAMIEEDIERIIAHTDVAALQALRRLSSKATLVMLSCGTTDLARLFAEKTGIADLFSGYYGKTFTFREGRVSGFTSDVPDTKAKADHIRLWKRQHRHVFAVGDGLTDAEMLAESDYGILVRYDGKPFPLDFPTVQDIPSAVEKLQEAITSLSSSTQALPGTP